MTIQTALDEPEAERRPWSPKIITVASYKGGVGKTTIAYELANLLSAPLVDLDWDGGNATRQWGYRHEDRYRAPLLDALERGRTPMPLRGTRKPDLIPCHPDLAHAQPTPEQMAAALERWANDWRSDYVVVDTHPGGVPTTAGAMAVASVVVTPVYLETKPLEALKEMLAELADYPILVVPNRVPGSPPAAETEKLARMTTAANVRVGPPISEHRWVARRKIRVALTSYGEDEPQRIKPIANELRQLAGAVYSYVS
ncbi:MAG: chromosome partitioning protein ParA [Pseudonocardiales bacterium]|nr:MAG: chromosome partitioning protein ParA [Pseudonocardiales bacterium]